MIINDKFNKLISHEPLNLTKDQIKNLNYDELQYLLLNKYDYIMYKIDHTEDLCLKIIQIYSGFFQNLKIQTPKLCKEAILACSDNFQYINNKNFKLCIFALKIDGLLLRFISEEKHNDILITIALKQNGSAIQYVKNQTKKYCLLAIKQNCCAIKYIKQTPELCKIAYENDKNSIYYINLNRIFYDKCDTTHDECSICLEKNYEEWCQLKCCQHKFHIDCIKNVQSCPLCRSNLIYEFN